MQGPNCETGNARQRTFYQAGLDIIHRVDIRKGVKEGRIRGVEGLEQKVYVKETTNGTGALALDDNEHARPD
jgi:hypothetical protein